MGLLHYLIYQTIFILIILGIIFLIRSQSDYQDAEYAKNTRKLLLYGFLGWLLAFVRIIIIQLYQILLLVREGIDIGDQEAIQNAAITGTYLFNILGPLLSGLFEEGIRYWLLYKAIEISKNPVDRKYAPAIFGLGWAYSEIMILTTGFISVESISFLNLVISGYERFITLFVHVSFTYLVLYAKFDGKKSLWLAMVLHTMVNLVALVLVLELQLMNALQQVLIIEGVLTVITIGIVVFTKRYIQKKEDTIASEMSS